MASRFLSQTDRNFFETVNKELLGSPRDAKDGIINTFVKLFRLSVENTTTNLYGEAAAGKIYLPGVQLPTLISAEDFDFNTDEFGPDLRQTATFSFEREYLVGLPLVTSIGDWFLLGDKFDVMSPDSKKCQDIKNTDCYSFIKNREIKRKN